MAKIPVLGQDRRLGPSASEPAHGSTQGQGAMDQSKKTMRHFYCRDVLWETFEQMANDFDCSIDYLINEAMRFYARSKNYNAGAAPPSSPSVPAATAGRGPAPTVAHGRRRNDNNAAPRVRRRGRRCRRRLRRATRDAARRRRATRAGRPRRAAECRRRVRRARDAGAAQSAHHARAVERHVADAVPGVQQPAHPDRQGSVHHRARLEDVATWRSRTATSRASTPP